MSVGIDGQPRGRDADLVAVISVIIIIVGFTPAAPLIAVGLVAAVVLALLYIFVIEPIVWNWTIDREISRPLTKEEQVICDETRMDLGLAPMYGASPRE